MDRFLAWLAEAWGLPPRLIRAISEHARRPGDFLQEEPLEACVAEARALARAYGLSDGVLPENVILALS